MPRRPRIGAVAQAAHRRAGALNGLENSSPPSRLKRAVKPAPSPRRMRFGGERGIVDHANQRVSHAGLVKRLKDPHRVAAPAAARIVGDVGEDQRGLEGPRCVLASRTASSSDVSVGAEPLAPRPAGLGDLARQSPAPRRHPSR